MEWNGMECKTNTRHATIVFSRLFHQSFLSSVVVVDSVFVVVVLVVVGCDTLLLDMRDFVIPQYPEGLEKDHKDGRVFVKNIVAVKSKSERDINALIDGTFTTSTQHNQQLLLQATITTQCYNCH
jgi:hypothetical protein